MPDITKRRALVAAIASALLFVGACDDGDTIPQDPQGPATNAPGTQGPQPTPTG